MEKVKTPQDFIPGRRYWLNGSKNVHGEFVKLDNVNDPMFVDVIGCAVVINEDGRVCLFFNVHDFELIP